MRKNQPYEDLAEKEHVWDPELRKNICNWRSERSGRLNVNGTEWEQTRLIWSRQWLDHRRYYQLGWKGQNTQFKIEKKWPFDLHNTKAFGKGLLLDKDWLKVYQDQISLSSLSSISSHRSFLPRFVGLK